MTASIKVSVARRRPPGHGHRDPAGRDRDLRAERLAARLAGAPGSRKSQVKPLPKGKFTTLTIPLYYQGHAYRAGSRIRVTLSAPGGDQPEWSFAETVPAKPGTQVTVGQTALTLPVVPGVAIPTPLPPCPGLRGEPCRSVG